MSFLDGVIFPYCISYGSDGAEVFSTDINVVDSGHEQRIAAWDQPLMEYNIAYGVRSMDDLQSLKQLFRVTRGPRDGFRFRDPVDFTSSFAIGDDSRKADPISPTDQIIGTGDGASLTFQLTKTYAFGNGTPSIRKIYKPEIGSVLLAQDGRPYPSANFSVDYDTGIVTTSSIAVDIVGGTVNMSAAYSAGNRYRDITWDDAHTINNLEVGDIVSVNGFDLAGNFITWPDGFVVNFIDNSSKKLTLFQLNGYDGSKGVLESKAGATVTITSSPYPVDGSIITAGYTFHIPVRFAVDRLPISLDSYGIGSATDLKLVELRGAC